MKKQTLNKEISMENEKSITLFQKNCEELAKSAQQVIKNYENYLLDDIDWRQLAKTMTKLRSALSGYYASGGK